MPPRLKLQYEASANSSLPDFCKGHKPAVTITFICPSHRHQVGGTRSDTWKLNWLIYQRSHAARLLSSFLCNLCWQSVWCPLLGKYVTAAHSWFLSPLTFADLEQCLFLSAALFFKKNVFAMFSQGSSPKMTAESNCRYEVEWVTEYACHRDYLESHGCKLNNEQHDLSIDLTPLTRNCKRFLSPGEIWSWCS